MFSVFGICTLLLWHFLTLDSDLSCSDFSKLHRLEEDITSGSFLNETTAVLFKDSWVTLSMIQSCSMRVSVFNGVEFIPHWYTQASSVVSPMPDVSSKYPRRVFLVVSQT
ncbi:uncharacterized protein EV420DRAFT_1150360 [Desarmillaria tabescens]|uniref:Uncharacterized protein n=1 Tax=Armillaria tabescens TaxID=1929756 RepID=A0AA39TYD6_ARMTA|nr:uncharacterized protein EV420DRAFT_1150360 [Desarmillaria tabescens]KAK0463020.1 hypothetical protein EV420DRAFT_1150360 [Desarmillaria tabescens]